MRKIIAILLAVMLMIVNVPVSMAKGNPIGNDITIKTPTIVPEGTLQLNQSFILSVDLNNANMDTDASDVKLNFVNNSSFSFEKGSTINGERVIDVGTLAKNTSKTIQIPMKYIGGTSTNLTLYATYKINGETKDTQEIYYNISAQQPQPSEPPQGEPNPDMSSPELSVLNTSIPKASPGETFNLLLTIANNSYNYARDITITPVLQEGSPFQFASINPSVYLDSIDGTKSKDISFNLGVASNASPGTYPIQLKYKFSNLFGDKYTTDETVYIKIEEGSVTPNITVSKVDYPQNGLVTGTVVPVKLTLSNKGSKVAKNIVVTLKGLETGKFTIDGSGNRATIASVYKGLDEVVTFNIRVAGSMAAGSHDLSALIEYKDDAGNVYTRESQFFLPVSTGSPEASGLQVQNIAVSSKAFQTDENIPIRFNLVNNGSSKLYGVEVSLTADEVILPRTQAKQSLGVMEPGKSKALEFTFFAKKEAITRNYPIGIEVSYKTGPDGEPIKMLQYVGVYVENKESDGSGSKSVPKIIIDSYSTDPVIVRAGSNFNLKISFHNTNSVKTVSNIKVSFTAPSETEKGSVFTPVNSSNTFYIDSIAPKTSIEMERVYYTIPDADAKTYTIIANFEYEYEGLDGAPVTAQEQIGIPVVQQTRLETSMINMPPTSFMGQPIPLNFEFYNMGKVTLSNLMITVEGDFTSSTPNYFVGNFMAGNSDYFDTMLTPNATGQLTGTIVFSYDDAAGEQQEVRKEFSTTVEEMPAEAYNPDFPGGMPGEMPPDMPGQQPTGIMKIVKSPITWIVVGVIVLGTAALFIVKKIKKRKELTLDE